MFSTLKEQVKKILVECPETRNSDITLTIKIWQFFYGVEETIAVKRLYELPREDNVKRIRAKFCEQGYVWAYPTELKVAIGRGIKEDEWRMRLGYPPKVAPVVHNFTKPVFSYNEKEAKRREEAELEKLKLRLL